MINKEHTTSPDVKIMYEEMVRRQNEEKSTISEIVEKREVRMEADAGSRAMWAGLSYDEQVIRRQRLQSALNRLIESHPDYSCFRTVEVLYGDTPGLIKIRWNGVNIESPAGWGSMSREFPEEMLPVIHKRYLDRLRLQIKMSDEEIEL